MVHRRADDLHGRIEQMGTEAAICMCVATGSGAGHVDRVYTCID